jgi:hypothetical protein
VVVPYSEALDDNDDIFDDMDENLIEGMEEDEADDDPEVLAALLEQSRLREPDPPYQSKLIFINANTGPAEVDDHDQPGPYFFDDYFDDDDDAPPADFNEMASGNRDLDDTDIIDPRKHIVDAPGCG